MKAMPTIRPIGASYTRAMSFWSLAMTSDFRSTSVPGIARRSRSVTALRPGRRTDEQEALQAGARSSDCEGPDPGEGDRARPERRPVRKADDGHERSSSVIAIADGDVVLFGRTSIDDELVVGRRLASFDELPRPAPDRRVVADEEEAVLAAVAIEDDELRHHRDDALDARCLSNAALGPGGRAELVPRKLRIPRSATTTSRACCRGRPPPAGRPPPGSRRAAGSG